MLPANGRVEHLRNYNRNFDNKNLYYNTGNGTARYNGNISSMTWKSRDEGTTRGYKFTYDGLDRMLNATYGEGTAISTNTNRFSENVTGYDKNGNIKTLQRYGQTSSSVYGLIDNLVYTLNGNQLNRVDDAVSASAYNNGFEFRNGASAADEYAYDANGNLTEDSNKGITEIQYNVLNLPSCIKFGSDNITYIYSAEGTKLRTIHKIGSTTTTTDYCGNVIYENNTAKLLLTEQGYVSLNDNKYHYYLQDHQGNNRVVVDKDGNVEETNHYYPFGGIFANTNNVQTYKYNGKELDVKKGLDWYDYGARHYDAALGRFVTVDLLAEKYYSVTPYNYCLNNPVNAIDFDGRSTWVMNNSNGTYRVVGGDITDKDRNIYVYNMLDGKMIRGESIGMTTSTTSFYNSDLDEGKGRWMIGSIIDSNDKSGDNFLSEIIGKNPPMFNDYIMNARNGHKYDFKVTNGTDSKIEGIMPYRGMPIGKNGNGQVIYTSARDIGNIAAGYIAGANGMPWEASRAAFDSYQSKVSGKLTMEGISTRNAEYYGWRMGSNVTPANKIINLWKSMSSGFR